jgi:hypothetical protein
MQKVFRLIDEKVKVFENIDFFSHYFDVPKFSAEQKLVWIAFKLPFVLGYSDLNKYVFRNENIKDVIQTELNMHTYEEDFHWQWLLADVTQLGFDPKICLTDAARILWGEEAGLARKVILEILQLVNKYNKTYATFVIVEAIEAISITWFKKSVSLRDKRGNQLQFFGKKHYDLEANHVIKDESHCHATKIELTTSELEVAKEAVDSVFEIFSNWLNGLYLYAKKNNFPSKTDYINIIDISKKVRFDESTGDYK